MVVGPAAVRGLPADVGLQPLREAPALLPAPRILIAIVGLVDRDLVGRVVVPLDDLQNVGGIMITDRASGWEGKLLYHHE